MGYRTFTTAEYSALRRQHNIMVLVGNGFDIQVARRYESRFSPRYPAFYYYLLSRDFDSSNLVVQQMAAAKEDGQENWSDVEAAIGRLITPEGDGTRLTPSTSRRSPSRQHSRSIWSSSHRPNCSPKSARTQRRAPWL